MLKSPLARTGLFLAISALLAPKLLLAQDVTAAPTVSEAELDEIAEQPSVLDEVEVVGEYIPQPLLETSEVVSVEGSGSPVPSPRHPQRSEGRSEGWAPSLVPSIARDLFSRPLGAISTGLSHVRSLPAVGTRDATTNRQSPVTNH